MALFHIHVTSSDSLGMNLIENVVKLANMGAVVKPGTIPAMRFPHSVSMLLEADEAPYTSACIRVFEADSSQEIKNPQPVVEPVSATFSMDSVDDSVGEKTLNLDKVYTKEELLAMDFDTEFREVCKAVGVTGRGRDKMIKEYLEKVA